MEADSVQFCTSIRPDTVPDCDPAWKTETVTALARGIHEEQAFDRLPILADALEEAGCQNQEVLDHCRGEVHHFRSCWVIDWLILQDRIAANYQRMLALQCNEVRYEAEIQHQAEAYERRKQFYIFIVLGFVGVGLPGLILALLMYDRNAVSPPLTQPVMPINWWEIRNTEPNTSEFPAIRATTPAGAKYTPLIKHLQKSGIQKHDNTAVPPELPTVVIPPTTEVLPKSK